MSRLPSNIVDRVDCAVKGRRRRSSLPGVRTADVNDDRGVLPRLLAADRARSQNALSLPVGFAGGISWSCFEIVSLDMQARD